MVRENQFYGLKLEILELQTLDNFDKIINDLSYRIYLMSTHIPEISIFIAYIYI